MRRAGEMICNKSRDQGSRVRDQKRNELGCSGLGDREGGGLDREGEEPSVEMREAKNRES